MSTSTSTPRVILVTGAEQGLGTTIKEVLEAHGDLVHNIPGSVMMGGKSAIEDWVSHFRGHHFDVLVNNFGVNHLSWIGQTPARDELIMQVNVMAPYWLINALIAAGYTLNKRVLNIASQTYKVPQRTTALYCASKAALVQMTRVMARELAPAGWVINALAPGRIETTQMTRLTDAQVKSLRGWSKEEMDTYARKLIPMGRYTSCIEVAKAVHQVLALPAYINGTVIDMTGGV